MAWFLQSGWVAALMLAVTAIEGITLARLYRRTGRGVPPAALWPNLGAGACLVVALALALTGNAGGWPLAVCLLGSLAAHLLDLRARWQR